MNQFFNIGAIRIALEYESGDYRVFFEKALRKFIAEPSNNPDIRFRIDTTSPFPSLGSYRNIFVSYPGGSWSILEDSERSHYLIAFQNMNNEGEHCRIVRADRRFADFVIYERPTARRVIFPFVYPFTDLAIAGYMNINKIGIILHSACISLKGKGYLFAGVSGSGKSTISEIWRKERDVAVLTDERVILREFKNDLWAFGTPWHGTSHIYKNLGAPVEKIFFIKHGRKNRAIPVSKTDAATRLMVRCFPAFWNRDAMQFVLDFCAVVADKECYDFRFRPDQSATSYLKERDRKKQFP